MMKYLCAADVARVYYDYGVEIQRFSLCGGWANVFVDHFLVRQIRQKVALTAFVDGAFKLSIFYFKTHDFEIVQVASLIL